MLTRLGGIVQRRLQLQQQQNDKTALPSLKKAVCSGRRPHYAPPEASASTLTLLLQNAKTAMIWK